MAAHLKHLKTAADRLANWLPDQCEIREPDGDPVESDTFPYRLVHTPGQLVYCGPCFLQGIPSPTASGHHNGEDILTETHRLRLPDTTDLPSIGSIVTVTGSMRDQTLVGRTFVVADTASDTALVSRQLALRSIERTERVD